MKLVGEQLVLDTNILVHLLRGKHASAVIEQTYGVSGRRPRAVISVVTTSRAWRSACAWSGCSSRT